MIVWAIANQKGGVGKTTTTVSLAGWMAYAGKKVLLMDLDPHGSLTSYFFYDPDEIENSAYNLFEQNISLDLVKRSIIPSGVDNIDLLPSSTALATLDRQLGTHQGMGLKISKAIKLLQNSYDAVMIDCPPVLGILMVNALVACDQIIVPVQTEYLALKGVERLQNTLLMIEQSKGEKVNWIIVPTMFDKRTNASIKSLKTLKEKYQYRVWGRVIPIDTRFRDSSVEGKPINLISPETRGAIAYRQLLEFLSGEKINYKGGT